MISPWSQQWAHCRTRCMEDWSGINMIYKINMLEYMSLSSDGICMGWVEQMITQFMRGQMAFLYEVNPKEEEKLSQHIVQAQK